MRFLWQFFPPTDGGFDPENPLQLPFTVSVAPNSKAFSYECANSQSWDSIYESHPFYDNDRLGSPVVVILGTRQFYDVLATMVRPLGRLANDKGFERHEYLLQLFTKQLNVLSGGHVCFLYGGTDCISDVSEVCVSLI